MRSSKPTMVCVLPVPGGPWISVTILRVSNTPNIARICDLFKCFYNFGSKKFCKLTGYGFCLSFGFIIKSHYLVNSNCLIAKNSLTYVENWSNLMNQNVLRILSSLSNSFVLEFTFTTNLLWSFWSVLSANPLKYINFLISGFVKYLSPTTKKSEYGLDKSCPSVCSCFTSVATNKSLTFKGNL